MKRANGDGEHHGPSVHRDSGLTIWAEKIRRTISRQLDDLRITAEAQSALDVLMPTTAVWVKVVTHDGVVYLRGQVVTEYQKTAAEGVIRSVHPPGMRRMVNQLIVNPYLPPTTWF